MSTRMGLPCRSHRGHPSGTLTWSWSHPVLKPVSCDTYTIILGNCSHFLISKDNIDFIWKCDDLASLAPHGIWYSFYLFCPNTWLSEMPETACLSKSKRNTSALIGSLAAVFENILHMYMSNRGQHGIMHHRLHRCRLFIIYLFIILFGVYSLRLEEVIFCLHKLVCKEKQQTNPLQADFKPSPAPDLNSLGGCSQVNSMLPCPLQKVNP